jgi:hypothetical protein
LATALTDQKQGCQQQRINQQQLGKGMHATTGTHKDLRTFFPIVEFLSYSDSPSHRCGESPTPQLPDSPIRGLSDSSTHRCGESATFINLIVDSLTYQYRESIFYYKYHRELEAKVKTARKFVKGTYAEPIYVKTSENTVRYHVF